MAVTATHRIANLERDARDHAKTISAIVDAAGRLDQRVGALEKAEMARSIMEAREEERDKALEVRLFGIEKKLDKILGSGSTLFWIVVTAIVGVVVVWLANGGWGGV